MRRSSIDTCLSLLRLGAPIIVSQLGTIVVSFADTAMVGNYATESLAAASFVNNLFNSALFTLMGFSYGVTPIVAALFSRGEKYAIGSTVRNGVLLNGMCGLLVIAVMTVLYFFIPYMGQPPELLPLIRPYYLIVLSSLVPLTIFGVFAQWSYGITRSKLPMWIIIGSNALNILGNWLLIGGHWGMPELGLNGAGISTLLARTACCVTLVWAFFAMRDFRDYRRGFIEKRPGGGERRRLLATSWPVACQMLFESGSFTVAAVICGTLGTLQLASFQVIVCFGSLGFCIYYGLATAVAVMVANASGRSDKPLMRHTAAAGYMLMLITAAISSSIFVLGGNTAISFFTNDPAVMAMSATLLLPLVLYQFADATQITFANALRGTARVRPMMGIAFVSYIVIGIPATYIMAHPLGWGVQGVVYSFTVSLMCAAALFVYYFRKATL